MHTVVARLVTDAGHPTDEDAAAYNEDWTRLRGRAERYVERLILLPARPGGRSREFKLPGAGEGTEVSGS